MNARWMLVLCLALGVISVGHAEGDQFLGLAGRPTTLVGIAYEKSWGGYSLGVSFGGASWGQGSGSTYLNPAVSMAYRLNRWTMTDEMVLELRTFGALGLYYYSGDATAKTPPATVVASELGFEVRYLVKKFFVIGLSLGQTFASNVAPDRTWDQLCLPLPGLTVGLVF